MRSNTILNSLRWGLCLALTAGLLSCKEKGDGPITYTEEEMAAIEAFVDESFGESDEVFHELVSPDIHVDILVVPPTAERNYYTLVTMGMGAREMHVPPQFRRYSTGRAEILVTLPPDWNIRSDAEEDYWPIRWLKNLARLPINMDTWLGYGHTVPNGEPFAGNTELSGVILWDPHLSGNEYVAVLPGGEKVEFLHLIPLYDEEMNYKLEHGAEAMFERFAPGFSHVIDINRTNYLKEEANHER